MPAMYLGALQHAFAACLEQQPQQQQGSQEEEDEAQREAQQEAYVASLQDFFRLAQKIAATYAGFSLSRPAIMQVRGGRERRRGCCCWCWGTCSLVALSRRRCRWLGLGQGASS
jgi:hypothetical protein